MKWINLSYEEFIKKLKNIDNTKNDINLICLDDYVIFMTRLKNKKYVYSSILPVCLNNIINIRKITMFDIKYFKYVIKIKKLKSFKIFGLCSGMDKNKKYYM